MDKALGLAIVCGLVTMLAITIVVDPASMVALLQVGIGSSLVGTVWVFFKEERKKLWATMIALLKPTSTSEDSHVERTASGEDLSAGSRQGRRRSEGVDGRTGPATSEDSTESS